MSENESPKDTLNVISAGYTHSRAFDQAKHIMDAMVRMGVDKCKIQVESSLKIIGLEKSAEISQAKIFSLEEECLALRDAVHFLINNEDSKAERAIENANQSKAGRDMLGAKFKYDPLDDGRS